MQGAAYVLYLVLGLFQIAATIAGIEHWLGLNWFVASIIAFFIASWPLVGTVLGVVGAHHGWGWPYLVAIALFFGPLIAIGGIVVVQDYWASRTVR